MKRLLTTLLFVLATSALCCDDEGCDSSAPGPSGSCCKVCKESKACGDSCISSNDTCTKPTGCACNGFDEE